MARLVINPDTPDAWSQELPAGDCLVGRSSDNAVTIEHPSVSSTHCRLTVSENQARLADLGSTNGTFVRGELVEQAELVPGAVFRLGDVRIRFETDAPVDGVAATPAPRPPRNHATCRSHPRAQANFFCGRCNASLCDICVQTQRGPGVTRIVCKKCGTACGPLAASVILEQGTTTRALLALLPGAFLYPFRGNGLFLLLAGGIFFVLLGFLPLIGLLLTGYLFNYAKAMVASTGMGEETPPDWPDFSNWFDDMVMPYLELLAMVVLTFGPALVANAFLPAWHPVLVLLVVYGAVVAPMAMLALAMLDTITVLNPVSLVWSIGRIPGAYSIAAIAFGIVITTYLYSDAVVQSFVSAPFVGFLVEGALNLYLLAVAMRILGLLYRSKRADLGWGA